MDNTLRHEPDDGLPPGEIDDLRSTDRLGTTPAKLRATIRLVAFDDLSDVRYLHAQCLKNLAGGELTDEEFAVARSYIYSTKYVDALGAAVRRRQLFGSWIGEALVGTAGWSTMEDANTVARIRSITG
jgi:hypothetical protein